MQQYKIAGIVYFVLLIFTENRSLVGTTFYFPSSTSILSVALDIKLQDFNLNTDKEKRSTRPS
jgi:hypothetical protein